MAFSIYSNQSRRNNFERYKNRQSLDALDRTDDAVVPLAFELYDGTVYGESWRCDTVYPARGKSFQTSGGTTQCPYGHRLPGRAKFARELEVVGI